MVRDGPVDLDELATTQDGVLTRAQALEHLSTEAVRHRIRPGGPWRRVLPGVYLTTTGVPDERQRLRAALLYAGGSAVLAGPSALVLHGLDAPAEDRRVHLLLPHPVRVARHRLVVVRRTRRELETTYRQGLPVCTLARAVLDTCRLLTSEREVRAVVAGAVQDRRVTVDALTAELSAGERSGSRLVRSVLAEVGAGVRSVSEAELRDLFATSTVLPPALWNCSLLFHGEWLADPDCYFEDAGLCVESDSRAWHLLPEDHDATMDRHLRMEATGLHVLHITPTRRRTHPAVVLARVEAAYLAARAAGVPAGITVTQRQLPAESELGRGQAAA